MWFILLIPRMSPQFEQMHYLTNESAASQRQTSGYFRMLIHFLLLWFIIFRSPLWPWEYFAHYGVFTVRWISFIILLTWQCWILHQSTVYPLCHTNSSIWHVCCDVRLRWRRANRSVFKHVQVFSMSKRVSACISVWAGRRWLCRKLILIAAAEH